MSATSFKITFATQGGTDYVLTISDCDRSIEASTVIDGIKDIVDSGALMTPHGLATAAKKAQMYIVQPSPLDVKE